MGKNLRVAFIINLYNLLILHAFCQVGIPTTSMQRNTFFDRIGYNVYVPPHLSKSLSC